MINELKKELIKNPKCIENILTKYEFYHIDVKRKEIRFARDEEGNPSSLRIKLIDNDNLYVKDFARGTNYDLLNFIIKTKGETFKGIIQLIKAELGISDTNFIKKKSIFGGFYDNIKIRKNNDIENKVYDDNILDNYIKAYNTKFLKDGISFETQRFFSLRYDLESQRIIIPIYDWCGNIIGIKGRANWNVSEDEAKYLYLIPCRISGTLYGYSQNYEYLYDNTIVVVESEKSVMKAYEYGYRNVVALGSNSISSHQCKLIMALQPREIIFALDEGLDIEITMQNIEKLKVYTKFYDIPIKYWNYQNSKYPPAVVYLPPRCVKSHLRSVRL